jgi:hypothetical protein
MAEFNFPGGRDGTSTNAFVGFRGMQGQIVIPAGPHQTNNGHWPIIVTGVSGTVRGGANTLASNQSTNPAYVSRSITLEIDDATTAAFTVAGGSPITTGLQNIAKYYPGLVFANGAFSRGNDTVAYRIRNASVDAYIRYGWQPTAGYTIYSINGNQSNSSIQGTLRNPGAPTGYIRYVYAPSAPRNLRFSSNGLTSVTLDWDAPTSDGETAITAYRLEWSRDGFANVEGSTTGNTITGLESDRTYSFRVAARNAVTDSQLTWSAYSNTLTKLATPSTPTLNVSRSGLTYTISGSSSITSGSISSYRFSSRSSTDGGSTFTAWTSETTLSGSTYSTTFASSAARTYQFRVRALSNSSVFSAYNSSGNFHTPNVPLIPTAEISLSKNVRKVTVDWDAFRTNANTNAVYNGAVISSYQVEQRYSNDSGATWETSYTNIGNINSPTTVLITGDLLIAKTYQFRIRAASDVGTSAYQSSPLIFISAYGQRRNSVPQSDTVNKKFDPIETARRFNGTSWDIVLMAKRFNGTSWVDLTN